jgi:hypothetical protein
MRHWDLNRPRPRPSVSCSSHCRSWRSRSTTTEIDITDAVSSPSTTDILDRCYNAGQNPGFTLNEFCGMIGRNTINGTFNGNEHAAS